MTYVRSYKNNDGNLAKAEFGFTVVDFYADWCGPCQAFAPHFEQLASGFAGKIDFVKVNVDAAPELTQRFGIRSIPTVVVLKGDQEAVRFVGAPRPSDLKAYLHKLLGSASSA